MYVFKKKPATLLAAAVLMALLLAACGGTPATATPSASPAGSSATPSTTPSANYTFVYNGTEIAMGADMAGIIEKLGEASDVFISPSCAFDGEDKIFYYPGIEIYTYPEGEQDFVLSVSLKDDTIATTEGLLLGAAADDVIALYGEPDEHSGDFYRYFSADGITELRILLSDNGVAAIAYYHIGKSAEADAAQ